MNEERIKEVFSDEAFVKELFSKETPEEAQAMLEEKGLAVTVDDLVQLKEVLVEKYQKAQSGEELAEEALEAVAGGSAFFIFSAVLVLGTLAGFTIAVMATDRKNRW